MEIPKYVKLGENGSALRKHGYTYRRDAGDWSIKYKLKYDELYSDEKYMPILDDIKLISITEAEWFEENKDYLPENYKREIK